MASNPNPLPDYSTTLTSGEPVSPSEPPLHRIFLGKNGLRAVWSLLVFIGLFAALVFCTNRVLHRIFPADPSTGKIPTTISESTGFLFLAEGIPLLITILITWVMSKVEDRPVGVYGLGGKRKLSLFLGGLAWGVVCLSILVGTLLKAGLLVIDGRALFGSDIVRYGLMWLGGFLLVGLLEEYLTRGFVQYTLSRGLASVYEWAFKTRHGAVLGFWTSAIIFSLLFGLGHGKNPGESPIGMLSAGLAGMVFCLSLWRTGSLWWAIGLHTSWDWGQSFLFGVADSGLMVPHRLLNTHPVGKPILSGGATGPEGSIFILAVLAVMALIIVFSFPRKALVSSTP